MMRTSEAPLLKRRPSDYIRDMYFTSQPLETSNLKLTQATMEAINADTQLLFASDWPHWYFDVPASMPRKSMRPSSAMSCRPAWVRTPRGKRLFAAVALRVSPP